MCISEAQVYTMCISEVKVYTTCVIFGLFYTQELLYTIISLVINPRRACAARVTVVGLCVCLSVCLFVCLFVCRRLFSHYRVRGGL